MSGGDFDGFELPPRSGKAGEATPEAAEHWLAKWRKIGGGITIGTDERVNPWRAIPSGLPKEIRDLADEMQTELLRELDDTPGLARAIRVVVSTNALATIRRSLKSMGKELPE